MGGLESEGLAADGDDIISVFILQDRIVRAIQQSVQIHDELRDLIAVRIHGGIGIPAIVSIFVAINIPAINGVAAVHQCPVVVLADPAQDQHIPVLVLGGTGRQIQVSPGRTGMVVEQVTGQPDRNAVVGVDAAAQLSGRVAGDDDGAADVKHFLLNGVGHAARNRAVGHGVADIDAATIFAAVFLDGIAADGGIRGGLALFRAGKINAAAALCSAGVARDHAVLDGEGSVFDGPAVLAAHADAAAGTIGCGVIRDPAVVDGKIAAVRADTAAAIAGGVVPVAGNGAVHDLDGAAGAIGFLSAQVNGDGAGDGLFVQVQPDPVKDGQAAGVVFLQDDLLTGFGILHDRFKIAHHGAVFVGSLGVQGDLPGLAGQHHADAAGLYGGRGNAGLHGRLCGVRAGNGDLWGLRRFSVFGSIGILRCFLSGIGGIFGIFCRFRRLSGRVCGCFCSGHVHHHRVRPGQGRQDRRIPGGGGFRLLSGRFLGALGRRFFHRVRGSFGGGFFRSNRFRGRLVLGGSVGSGRGLHIGGGFGGFCPCGKRAGGHTGGEGQRHGGQFELFVCHTIHLLADQMHTIKA